MSDCRETARGGGARGSMGLQSYGSPRQVVSGISLDCKPPFDGRTVWSIWRTVSCIWRAYRASVRRSPMPYIDSSTVLSLEHIVNGQGCTATTRLCQCQACKFNCCLISFYVWGLQLSVRGANAKLHQKEGNNQECQGRSVDPKAKGQRSSHATTTCHKQIRSLQVSIQPSSLDVAPTFTKLTCLRVFSDSVPLLVEHITRDH